MVADQEVAEVAEVVEEDNLTVIIYIQFCKSEKHKSLILTFLLSLSLIGINDRLKS